MLSLLYLLVSYSEEYYHRDLNRSFEDRLDVFYQRLFQNKNFIRILNQYLEKYPSAEQVSWNGFPPYIVKEFKYFYSTTSNQFEECDNPHIFLFLYRRYDQRRKDPHSSHSFSNQYIPNIKSSIYTNEKIGDSSTSNLLNYALSRISFPQFQELQNKGWLEMGFTLMKSLEHNKELSKFLDIGGRQVIQNNLIYFVENFDLDLLYNNNFINQENLEEVAKIRPKVIFYADRDNLNVEHVIPILINYLLQTRFGYKFNECHPDPYFDHLKRILKKYPNFHQRFIIQGRGKYNLPLVDLLLKVGGILPFKDKIFLDSCLFSYPRIVEHLLPGAKKYPHLVEEGIRLATNDATKHGNPEILKILQEK